MSNQWLRLWHDLPTDPKWRVIAKVSNQPLHLVIALYVVLLVDASKNTMSRGVTKCHDEDLAVTLDCDMSQITEIKKAMQGRVLDGDELKGWRVRQPKKEDAGNPETSAKSAAERKREQRQRDLELLNPGACHEMSRNVTTDKDKDKEVNIPTSVGMLSVSQRKNTTKPQSSNSEKFEEFWKAWPVHFRKVDKKKCAARWMRNRLDDKADTVMACLERTKASAEWDDPGFIPMPATWLGREPWLETNVIVLGYTDTELEVIEKYNGVMVAAGWPEATAELYSRDRAVAIGRFMKFSDKPGDWVTAYFEWLAEALEPRSTTGFDWAIREETFLRAKEGTFAVRAAQ